MNLYLPKNATLAEVFYFSEIVIIQIFKHVLHWFERLTGITGFGLSQICSIVGAILAIFSFFSLLREARGFGEHAPIAGGVFMVITLFQMCYLYFIGKNAARRFDLFMERGLNTFENTGVIWDRSRLYWLAISSSGSLILLLSIEKGWNIAEYIVRPITLFYPTLMLGATKPCYKPTRVGQEIRKWKKIRTFICVFFLFAWLVQVASMEMDTAHTILLLFIHTAIIGLLCEVFKPKRNSSWKSEEQEDQENQNDGS